MAAVVCLQRGMLLSGVGMSSICYAGAMLLWAVCVGSPLAIAIDDFIPLTMSNYCKSTIEKPTTGTAVKTCLKRLHVRVEALANVQLPHSNCNLCM